MNEIGASALSSGLGFVASLGGSVGGGLFSANQARKNRAFQERMYHKQVEDNIKFWKMQNEYNLPSAQIERLRNALPGGLNPLLMYGEGGISGNLAQQQVQSGTAPHGAQGSVGSFNTRLDLANLAMLAEQKDNLRASSEKMRSEALLAADQAIKTREDTKYRQNENLSFWDRFRNDTMVSLAEANYKKALETESRYKLDEISATVKNLEQMTSYYKSQVETSEKLSEQQIKESNQRIENSIKETAATVRNLDANARKAVAEGVYYDLQNKLMQDPEYRGAIKKEQLERVRKAIAEGNEAEIDAGLKALFYSHQPKPGDPSYTWKTYIDHWLTPVTESVGHILGGGINFSKKL